MFKDSDEKNEIGFPLNIKIDKTKIEKLNDLDDEVETVDNIISDLKRNNKPLDLINNCLEKREELVNNVKSLFITMTVLDKVYLFINRPKLLCNSLFPKHIANYLALILASMIFLLCLPFKFMRQVRKLYFLKSEAVL